MEPEKVVVIIRKSIAGRLHYRDPRPLIMIFIGEH